MTSRIDVIAPATITVLGGGSALASLGSLPPYGITVSDPDMADNVTLTVVAANTGAVLSAVAAGATVIANGNSLSITGTSTQVSAALSTLQIVEPGSATTDTLVLTAGDPAVLSDKTAIAVAVLPAGAPGFAAPPASATVTPNGLTAVPGLVLGDPGAVALTAAGQGRGETLQISLSVGAGVLLLPGFSALDGVGIAGLGTGTVLLDFTADQLGTVNALLAGLTYAGGGQTRLHYGVTDISGAFGTATSFGTITLTASGTMGATGTYAAGNQTVIIGAASIAAGSALDVTGVVAALGGINGAVWIPDGATLEVPGGIISLSGTSYDFGLASAASLTLSGNAIFANGASFSGSVAVAQGLADFTGTLGATTVQLAANAVLTGDGSILAAMITGPGTLMAAGGDTLLAAAAVSGGAQLDVAGGSVLVLGAGIASSVTLSFAAGTGVAPIAGVYADSLAQSGGVIVIDDPQAFSGTLAGFMPGDRLLFPGLTALTISNVTANSFEITARNSANANVGYTFNAAIPAGTTLVAGTDAGGDGEIRLRAGSLEVAVGGSAFGSGSIDATAGTLQNILGLQVLLQNWTSQSLTLTLAVGDGVLTDGTLTPAAELVITAASPAALDAALAALAYTETIATAQDTLVVSSNTGLLAGLDATIPITIKSAGTVTGFGTAPTDAQTALFAGGYRLVTHPAATGEILVTGAAEFANLLVASGIGGTALLVDAGGTAVFDAGSGASFGSNGTVGDAGGAGTLGIETQDFEIGTGAALVIASNSAAAGSVVEITGGLMVGNLILGEAAAARLDLSGDLVASTTIDAAGVLTATGNATASFGGLVDSGTLVLDDNVQAVAANLILTGQLQLGGTASLTGLSSAVVGGAGRLAIGPEADFSAGALNAISGGISVAGVLQVAGNLLDDAGITLSGGRLDAAALTLGTGGSLSGFGDVGLGAAASRIVVAGGAIVASDGLLALDGNVTMTSGSIAIAGGAALDLIHGAGGTIAFEGANSELTINDLAVDSAAVVGMVGHDVIDLVGITPALVSYSGGVVSAEDAGGNPIGSFALSVATGQPAVTITADGFGGALITLADEMACFARGTRLLTPNGYVAVEAFKPGDPIVTHAGVKKPVRWIGRRVMDTRLKSRTDLRPVVVMPGALAPGCPGAPVQLSPAHGLFLDGALVPVMHLVNGVTILRAGRRRPVTYYHIELDRHEIVVADGLPVETYLDTGNRGQFDRETGIRGQANKTCAPLVTGGPKLAQIRWRLHRATLDAGFTLVREPRLRGMVQDLRLTPEILSHNGLTAARFRLPQAAGRIMLLADSAAPADTDPESDDRRELGICLAQPSNARAQLQLGVGWYEKASADAGIWMGGSGEVLLPPGMTELTLHLAAVAQSWRPPPRIDF